MKDSGVEWIGEIPEGWEIIKGKFLFRARNSKGNETLQLLSASQTHGMCPQEMLEGVVKVKDDADLQTFKTVHQGDFVISLRSFQGGFEYSMYEGVCSPAYQVFYPITETRDGYYRFLFKTGPFIETLNSITLGIREGKNILFADFSQFLLPLPPAQEQQRIADFLDAQTAEIDASIAKTQESIEEYKKLKQAVITQAVTKGTRPGRVMKDSGVEWIGEIPEEWEVTKTLRALEMPITDGPHETPVLYDSGIPFISAEAVSCGNGDIDFEHKRGYISGSYYQECCKKYTPRLNDIYMIKSGATTGRVAQVRTTELFTIWSPLAVFRADETRCHHRFLFFFLQSEAYQKQVELGWTYGTQQNIGMRSLEKLKLTLPPVSEQQEIAAYLDEKCAAIDTLIEKKQAIITELEAYKKSLIYEYVTGKKEVPMVSC